jgi:hypothetical protein
MPQPHRPMPKRRLPARASARTTTILCAFSTALVFSAAAEAAPTLSIITPAKGATVSGTVVWRVKVSPWPVRVAFRVDGRLKHVSRVAPFSYRWDTRAVRNGRHTLAVRAVWLVSGRTVSWTTTGRMLLAAATNGTKVSGTKKRDIKVRNSTEEPAPEEPEPSPEPAPEANPEPEPSPEPAPEPSAERDPAKLTWAPPQLSNPVTIAVRDTQWYVAMDRSKDYIVKIGHHRPCAPSGTNKAGLWLEGGRNVVLIGGRISIPCESTAYGRTGIKIRNATGTVHIEGVVIDNSGGWLTDGIGVAAEEAVVQLQNLRIGPVWDNGNAHPDLVQVQTGVKELRIDKLTGTTTYQGIFLRHGGVSGCTETTCRNGPTHLKRVNVRLRNDLGAYTPNCGFFQQTKDIPVTIEDFFIDRTNTTRELGYLVHPTLSYVWDGDSTRRAQYSADRSFVYWPSSNIEGLVSPGAPSDGDYVPSGLAGQQYVSPGYW